MLFISPKRCASGFALSLLLIGCTLPPITRVSSVDVAVMDSPNFDVTAVDDLATPPDVLLTDVPIDVLRDVAVSGDGGVVFPATIQAQVVFQHPRTLLQPPTQLSSLSKLVINGAQIFATSWLVEDLSGRYPVQLYARPREPSGVWQMTTAFNGIANPGALTMDIEDRLYFTLTCRSGNCGNGLLSPGHVVTALLSYAPMAGMTYNYNMPTVEVDLAMSQGQSTVAASRRSNEIYWSHLLLNDTRKIRRIPAMLESSIANAMGSPLVPLISHFETTVSGTLFVLVSNNVRGDFTPAAYAQLTLYEFVGGVPTPRHTINAESPRPPAGLSELGVLASSMESSPDGTLFFHAHGRFDATNCTRVYRREPGAGGALSFTALGCHRYDAQLHVIDNSQLLLVEPLGATEGIRIGHSVDRGVNWRWRDVPVTFDRVLMGPVRFAAPSLVRPSTSPNGFDPSKVRMLFSLSAPGDGGFGYSGMAYAEFSLR